MTAEPPVWDPLAIRPSARPRIWAVLALIVAVTQGPSFVDSLRPEPTEGVDFFQEWSSARNHLEGHPVYDDLETAAGRYVGYRRGPGE